MIAVCCSDMFIVTKRYCCQKEAYPYLCFLEKSVRLSNSKEKGDKGKRAIKTESPVCFSDSTNSWSEYLCNYSVPLCAHASCMCTHLNYSALKDFGLLHCKSSVSSFLTVFDTCINLLKCGGEVRLPGSVAQVMTTGEILAAFQHGNHHELCHPTCQFGTLTGAAARHCTSRPLGRGFA